MRDDSQIDYTYDEVRQMFEAKMLGSVRRPNGKIIAQTQTAIDALTDEVLEIWENTGLLSRQTLQRQVEIWRDR